MWLTAARKARVSSENSASWACGLGMAARNRRESTPSSKTGRVQPNRFEEVPCLLSAMVILGTPVGNPYFVRSYLDRRLRKQRTFWQNSQQVPDMQAAWLLLLYCAVPGANNLFLSLPPDLTARYAADHDKGIWDIFLSKIRYQDWDDDPYSAKSRVIASFILVIQVGLGLRSSTLIALAAYWAAWTDICPIVVQSIAITFRHRRLVT